MAQRRSDAVGAGLLEFGRIRHIVSWLTRDALVLDRSNSGRGKAAR